MDLAKDEWRTADIEAGTELLDSDQEGGQGDINNDNTQHTWRSPRQNFWRYVSVIIGFLVLGMNDSSLGALIPSIEKHYDISHMKASTVFVPQFGGYILSALLCDYAHRKVGRWGCAFAATFTQLLCYFICVTAPAYPVFVMGYAIAGFGNGLTNAAWNAWVSSLQNSNTMMGIVHGAYGFGGTVCPSIFTAIIASGVQWNQCYSVMIAVSTFNTCMATLCWWGDTPRLYIASMEDSMKEQDDDFDEDPESNVRVDNGTSKLSIREVLQAKVVWLFAGILFIYVGTEVAIGGWASTFMISERGGNIDTAGFVTTAFFAGMTSGRIILGIVTEKIKREEPTLIVYLATALLLSVMFWTINVMAVSAVCVALIGFFTGPTFPIIMVVAAKKLPKRLHVSALGLIAALGGAGAAILPFVNGVISQLVGPRALGPYAVTALSVMIIGWWVLIRYF